MVDRFKQILKTITEEKGEVFLFALLKMDEFTDKWTVILSADWASSANRTEVFAYLRKVILKGLNKEEVASIARLGIFGKESQLIKELSNYGKDFLITNTIKINGNVVHEGYIFSTKN
jgi:hypothetical protein